MTPSDPTSRLRSAIAEEVDELAPRLVDFRRDLHAHPEPSREEYRTTTRIRESLLQMGLQPRSLPVETGLWVEIAPDGHAPVACGLRADIDALKLPDAKDVPYRSTQEGVAHACGHDVHTTVLLGTAKVLTRLRDRGLLTRGVRLFFQPAEEVSPGGARDIVSGDLLDGLREVYALHCDPRTEVGRVAVRTGPITSACDRFDLHFKGPGGHSSRPHLSADLVMAIGAVITEVPTLLSRRVDPRVGASLVWGKVQAGVAANVIPSEGRLAGTLRCLQLDGWQHARELIPELVQQVALPFGVEVDVRRSVGIPPTINHREPVGRLRQVISDLLGQQALADTEQSLGGEDFSEFLLHVPGALARLGVRPSGLEEWPDLHRPAFDVDEACMPVGVKVLSGLVALPR